MNPFIITTLCTALVASAFAADEILIADFEKDNYAPWTATGEAFGPGPSRGTMPGQMHVDGFKGKGLVNSFFKGDDSIGSLTSPEFRIERKFISLCPRYRGQRDQAPSHPASWLGRLGDCLPERATCCYAQSCRSDSNRENSHYPQVGGQPDSDQNEQSLECDLSPVGDPLRGGLVGRGTTHEFQFLNMNHLPKVITTLFMALPWSYGHAFEKGALKDKTLVVWVSKEEK